MTAQLSVRCLTRRYQRGATTALDRLDLDVPAGGCLALLGPSGSGKTTALRLLAGLEEPDDGRVLVDGADLRGVPPERRGMAMVFQRPLLLPHLSVLDNVAFSGRVRGWSRERARTEARRHLELVQMLPLAHRRVSALSGGQEQRVALARALAAQPRVLLLDEPFAALDPALREQMHDLVRALRAALQPTIVVVTHDRDEAAALADEVAVLDAGRVHQVGSVAELVRAPRTLTVARAMGARSVLAGTLRGGRHHSSLGALEVTDAAGRAPDGPAWLVLRQELVHVVTAGAGQCTGTVVDRRTVGVRLQVSVAVSDGSAGAPDVVHVELPPGHVVEVGTSVGLHLPADALSVVTEPTCPLTSHGHGSTDRLG